MRQLPERRREVGTRKRSSSTTRTGPNRPGRMRGQGRRMHGPLCQRPTRSGRQSHALPERCRGRCRRRSWMALKTDAWIDLVCPHRCPLLSEAEESCAGKLRQYRSRADRGLHRGRWLHRADPGANRDDAAASGRRSDESGLRGRGGAGYPTGLKWSTVAKSVGDTEICHLQCRRRRSRSVHGSQRAGERSAPRARRHADRRLRRGRAPTATSTCARNILWPLSACGRRSAKRSEPGLLGSNICGTRSAFKIDLRLGRGFCLRRRDGAHCLG